jgi:hypothetical protein
VATETIAERFRGPPGSGNGGWTCGTLARHLDGPAVEVTLRLPPPLEVPLAVVTEAASGRLVRDGEVVADGRVVDGLDADPAVVSWPEAEAATQRFLGFEHHAFPGCFTCGPDREPGDGLRLLAGPVVGQDGVVAAPWEPPPDLIGPGGVVDPRAVWAALDCPGAWAHLGAPDLAMVLGRLTAELRAPVPARERLVVTGRADGSDGRKAVATTAVLDGHGRALAVARSVWIVLDEMAVARFAAQVSAGDRSTTDA